MKPLYAVVSLLDAAHSRQVGQLYRTPFPHLSYHVAAEYDLGRLEAALHRVARAWPPFTVRTAGLGIFTGLTPVVYLPVVRSPLLSRLQAKLWREAGRLATGSLEYYHPELWIPHISVGRGEITQADLPEAVRDLASRDFHWEITVDNLAVISSCGLEHLRIELGSV